MRIEGKTAAIPKELALHPDYLGEKFSKPMAWIDLLLLSENGVVKSSLGVLADRWKWSKNKVSRFLSDLQANRSVERSVCNFEGCKTEQSIKILSTSYMASRNDSESFHGTFQKEVSPNPPVSPSSFPPVIPPFTSTPISPSSPFQEKPQESVYSVSDETFSHPIPKPLPQNPFILSSVERDVCRNVPSRIVALKRQKVARILESVSSNPEIDMPEPEQQLFLDWYCEPVSEGSERVRAENLQAFTVYGSAKRWMDKRRSMRAQQPKEGKQSLGDYYSDLMKRMKDKFSHGQDTSYPDEQ